MPVLGGRAREARFIFQINDINFAVADFSVREAISELFDINLTLASEEEIEFDDVIGQPAVLTLLESDPDRIFNGIVCEFVTTGLNGRFYVYQARVVPSAWLLSLEQDCRIFQNVTVRDISTQILNDRGITSDRFEFRLQNSYNARDYCVQYRETDLNFISRLLEEEGIFYFFEHDSEKHLMVFGDGTVNYQPIPGQARVTYRASGGLGATEEFVNDFRFSRQIRTGKVTVKDFNFIRPSLDLTSQKKSDYFEDLEQYDYPGEYLDENRGKGLAEIRLQESMALKDRAEGQSICPRFIPGYTFELINHNVETFNQEYLLIEIHHMGSQPQVFEERSSSDAASSYSNQFVGIPSSVVFRPARQTPKPVVEGVQTAIVVGPRSEEIYTDEYGRVKVQFHWDRLGQRDEHSSCWIRVSQVCAGAGWGAIDVPRIGHEVIVDFLEGDPDRPIITGRVYHGTNSPPFGLPDKGMVSGMKSNSTPGGGGYNEITLNDTKSKESITIHAQYDMGTTVEHDDSQTVHNNRTITVDGTHTETITKATKITISQGIYEHKVNTGTADYYVKGALTEKYDATQATTVKQNIEIKSTAGEILLEAANKITLHTGSSNITLESNGNITISGTKIAIIGKNEAGVSGGQKAMVTSKSEAKLGVGNQNIVCNTSKTALSGAAINASAIGMNEITGGVVKIN